MTFRIKDKIWLILALFFYLAFLLYTYFIFNLIYGNAIPEQIPGYPTKYITEFVLLSLFFLCSLSGIWLLKTPRLKKISIGLTIYALIIWCWHIAWFVYFWLIQHASFQEYMNYTSPQVIEKRISPNHKLQAYDILIQHYTYKTRQIEILPFPLIHGQASHVVIYVLGDACVTEPLAWKDNDNIVEVYETYNIHQPAKETYCQP